MKMTVAAGHGLAPTVGAVESGLGMMLLRALVRGLEWIGRIVEGRVPPGSDRRPELSYWRVHGWPF